MCYNNKIFKKKSAMCLCEFFNIQECKFCPNLIYRYLYFTDAKIIPFVLQIVDGEQRYACVTCGRLYKQKGTLTQHQRYECGKEPQFACTLCPYRAKQKGSLKTHLALKHSTKPLP